MGNFRGAGVTALQCATGILFLLAGWGWRDLPEFFSNPARAAFVGVAVSGTFVAMALRVDTDPIRKGVFSTKRQTRELSLLLLMSLFLMAFLPFADRRGLLVFHSSAVASGLRYAGLVLCAAGGSVRLLALRRLGRHFSAYVTLQPGHQLVQRGVYGCIRHPLYLSLLLAPAGIALVFASWLALPIFAMAVAFVADRIRKEERLLAEGFGPEFSAYRARTRMLIPGVL